MARLLRRITSMRLPVAIALVLGGCVQPSAREPSVDLVEIRRFPLEETDSLFIGRFGSMAVTRSPFRVYVPDNLSGRITVFDAAGSIIRTFGEPGEGPGELELPMQVMVSGNRLFVKEAERFSVFDTSGSYVRSMQTPDNIYPRERGSLVFYRDRLLLPAEDISQRVGTSMVRTRAQNSIAMMDTMMRQVEMMGQWPALFQEGEYTRQWGQLDVTDSGLLCVIYDLLNVVYVYDLEKPGRPLVRTIELDHPAWRPTEEEIPLSMSISERMERAVAASTALRVFVIGNEYLVLYFVNMHRDYYDRVGDDRAVDHYAVVATTGGKQLAALTLPGPIVARDERDLLYIRLSSVPDEREVGVYELVAQ